ncbi:hypothetical protein [Winogradskyella forsetii]|uniref:hypothetical protein n=1 Tax=Winogradskyella forsetii TaxID=2686077 RepID=UPI0015BF638E|nr:hypothetical protein [Winogradskyella forsetii]
MLTKREQRLTKSAYNAGLLFQRETNKTNIEPDKNMSHQAISNKYSYKNWKKQAE